MASAEKAKRLAGNRAAARGKTVSAQEQAAIDAAQAAKPKDLDDPKTQFAILNPETIAYTLDLASGPRPMEIKTVFSVTDIQKRRVYENIEAYRSLVIVEMSRFNRDARAGMVDSAWVAKNAQYIDVAMALPHVRELARSVIASIARFADTGEGMPHADESDFVDVEQIAEGMPRVQLAALSLHILRIATAQVSNQKNAAAAKRA